MRECARARPSPGRRRPRKEGPQRRPCTCLRQSAGVPALPAVPVPRGTPPGAPGAAPTVPMTGRRPAGAAIRRREARAVRALWNKHVIEQYMTKKIY